MKTELLTGKNTEMEDNILIAKFMGWKVMPGSLYFHIFKPNGKSPITIKRVLGWHSEDPAWKAIGNKTKYDKSWDWLMPVWEKIINLTGGVFEIGLYNSHSAWWYKKILESSIDGYTRKSKWDSISGEFYHYTVGNFKKSPEKVKANSRLEATYMVIVDFIKWYNKNNKK
jgi:hypothetical protein